MSEVPEADPEEWWMSFDALLAMQYQFLLEVRDGFRTNRLQVLPLVS